MPRLEIDYPDLGGGIDLGSNPSIIPRNRATEYENFYPFETRARRRGGTSRFTTGSSFGSGDLFTASPPITNPTFGETIVGMFPYKLATGEWHVVVGGIHRFGVVVGGVFYPLNTTGMPVLNPVPIPPDYLAHPANARWVMFQYRKALYALRPGSGLLRLAFVPGALQVPQALTMTRAGLPKPAPPTLVDGGAGALVAGTYRTVVTFYITDLDVESNPSDASNAVTIGAGRHFDYTSIPVSPNAFVNARRIYRTLENQQGTYFFVAQINDNLATTYNNEQVTVNNLGRSVSFDNGEPPAGLRVGCVHLERIFASDGKDLYFSGPLRPEGFGASARIPVEPDDGHELRALHSRRDGRLIIGKTNKIHYLVGSSEADFRLFTLDDQHGCVSHHSMQSAGGTLFWVSPDPYVMRWDGAGPPRDISSPRVAELLRRVPEANRESIAGAVVPKLDWYVLSLPVFEDPVEAGRMLVYNYKTDAWSIFRWNTKLASPGGGGGFIEKTLSPPSVLCDFYTSDFARSILGAVDKHIGVYNDESEEQDLFPVGATPAIRATWASPEDDFGYPGRQKYLDETWALVPTVPGGTMRLQAFGDGSPTATLDRTVALSGAGLKDWKAFSTPTFRSPATRWKLRLTYEGGPMIDLDQLHLVAGVLGRGPGQPR